MSKPLLTLTSVALITSGLWACTSATTESDGIENQAIWAGIRINSDDGVSSGVNVELNVGGSTGTNLVLTAGDRVVAISGSEQVELTEDSDFLDVDYEGVIQAGASGDEIRVSFERANSANISNSSVAMPDTFAISFPQTNMNFTELQDLEILWTAGAEGDEVNLIQAGVCKDTSNQDVSLNVSINVPDTGRYTTSFMTDSLGPLINNGPCDFSFEIIRTNTGTLDEGFGEGGFIRATQTRSVTGLKVQVG